MTKKIISGLAVSFFMATVLFTACKKEEPKVEEPAVQPTPTPAPAETGQSGIDSREVQGENDAAVDDINKVIADSRLAGKSSSGPGAALGATICGMSVDSVSIGSGSLTLNYDGVTTCNNRTRSGKIKLTMQNHPQKWTVAGSVIKIEYIDYKIVKASNQKSVKLNGVQYLTNVSGGNWWNLVLFSTPLIHSVTGTNLNVTFDDGKTAVYNINRKLTYTYVASSNVLSCKAEGIGSSGTLNNLENFGTTRDGDGFTSQVTTPIIWNTTCTGAVIQGAVDVKVVSKAFALKFIYGVNTAGVPVTVGPNQCPYGWKLEWTANSVTNSTVIPY
jgi:hypothetical protein